MIDQSELQGALLGTRLRYDLQKPLPVRSRYLIIDVGYFSNQTSLPLWGYYHNQEDDAKQVETTQMDEFTP